MPGLARSIDFNSRGQFVDKDVTTSFTLGSRHEVALQVQDKYQGRNAFLLVHIENHATAQTRFPKRLYPYETWPLAQYNLPGYPAALLSDAKLAKDAPDVSESRAITPWLNSRNLSGPANYLHQQSVWWMARTGAGYSSDLQSVSLQDVRSTRGHSWQYRAIEN